MTEENKIKNMFAFLSILFGEDEHLSRKLIDIPPSYLIEKWDRYIESKTAEHPWGMHPNLRSEFFDLYFEKWTKND